MTVHDCRFAEIRQTDKIPEELNPDVGSGEMNKERQIDEGSGELELEINKERQLEIGSGEPGQEEKIESQIVIGMCGRGSFISQTGASTL